MKKRLFSVIICIAMAVSLLPAAAFAEEPAVYRYLALGASESNGYGLTGYFDEAFSSNEFYLNPEDFLIDSNVRTGFGCTAANSYPVQVKNILSERFGEGTTVVLDQYAQCGMRIEELRFLLDDQYEGDGYTRWRFYDGTDNPKKWFTHEYLKLDGVNYEKNIDGLRSKYKDAVANADLITMDFGLNNFGPFVLNALLYGMYDVDFNELFTPEFAQFFFDLRSDINEQLINLTEGALTEEDLDDIYAFADVIPYAFVGYCKNFDICIDLIRELNPDAQIVVVGIPEFDASATLMIGGIEIPADELFNMLIENANAYTEKFSPWHYEFKYASLNTGDGIERLASDLLNYNGEFLYKQSDWEALNAEPETAAAKRRMAAELKSCFDVYDDSIRVMTNLTKAYKNRYPSSTDLQALSNADAAAPYAYDAFARLLKLAMNKKVLDMDFAINTNDTYDMEDRLEELVSSIISQAVLLERNDFDPVAYPLEGEYNPETFVAGLLSDDTLLSALAFYTRTYIGNSFFSHPSENGHAQIAQLVMNAYDSKLINPVQAVKDIKEEIANQTEYVWETIEDEFTQTWTEVIEKTTQAWKDFGSKVEEHWEDIAEQSRQVREEIRETITDSIHNTVDAIDNARDAIKEKIEENIPDEVLDKLLERADERKKRAGEIIDWLLNPANR